MPSDPKPAGDDRNLVAVNETYVAPSFEDRLQSFWKSNRKTIGVACAAVLAVILAKGGWEIYHAQRESDVRAEYAAATTTDQLKAFAAAHPGHTLAGLSHLRMADEAYAANKFTDALSSYEKAATTLKTGPFAARAQMGVAMAKIGAGNVAEGESALKQLADDANQLKGVRAEAAYHLASLAAAAGRTEDVRKFSEQVMQVDPSSPWTQRALQLRATLPETAAAVSTPAADAKQEEASPGVQLKLPGK